MSNVLFHASHNGIKGDIAPLSRAKCDFGQGFYMTTRPNQALGLVLKDDTPRKYELCIHKDGLNFLRLKGEDWFYTVLYNRGALSDFKGTEMYNRYQHILDGVDVVIGNIADDSLNNAIRAFKDGLITDKVTMEYISGVSLGVQIVALTQKACDNIEILSDLPITAKDKEAGRNFNRWKQEGTKKILADVSIKYKGQGQFIGELLDKARGLEKGDDDYDFDI